MLTCAGECRPDRRCGLLSHRFILCAQSIGSVRQLTVFHLVVVLLALAKAFGLTAVDPDATSLILARDF